MVGKLEAKLVHPLDEFQKGQVAIFIAKIRGRENLKVKESAANLNNSNKKSEKKLIVYLLKLKSQVFCITLWNFYE
jgi:hypothetical protein